MRTAAGSISEDARTDAGSVSPAVLPSDGRRLDGALGLRDRKLNCKKAHRFGRYKRCKAVGHGRDCLRSAACLCEDLPARPRRWARAATFVCIGRAFNRVDGVQAWLVRSGMVSGARTALCCKRQLHLSPSGACKRQCSGGQRMWGRLSAQSLDVVCSQSQRRTRDS